MRMSPDICRVCVVELSTGLVDNSLLQVADLDKRRFPWNLFVLPNWIMIWQSISICANGNRLWPAETLRPGRSGCALMNSWVDLLVEVDQRLNVHHHVGTASTSDML